MLQLTSDPKRTSLLLVAGLAAVAALLYLWWPAGTVLGLVGGLAAVHRIGTRMQRAADAQQWSDLHEVAGWLEPEEPVVAEPARLETAPAVAAAGVPDEPVAPARLEVAAAMPARPAIRDEIREQLSGLKAQLGDDYPDFARAARLVVETQYASAARLQRELQVPYSRARRLLTDLEQQHFVGPATGSLPRQVLMPKDRLPELEEILPAA